MALVVADHVVGLFRHTGNRQVIAERAELGRRRIRQRKVRLDAETVGECVITAQFQTLNAASTAVDQRGHVGGGPADAVLHEGRNVRRCDEIVDRLVEVARADQGARREVILVGQVELRSAERVETRVASRTTLELESHLTAGAVRSAGKAVLKAAADVIEILRCNNPRCAEAQLLGVSRIQGEVKRRQDVVVAAALGEADVVGIDAVPRRRSHVGRAVRIGLAAAHFQ